LCAGALGGFGAIFGSGGGGAVPGGAVGGWGTPPFVPQSGNQTAVAGGNVFS
jgi:hypothetical protein